MTMITHYVGLDVHKDSIALAVAELGRGRAKLLSTIPNDSVKLLKKLDKIGPRESISCCYEAGPTGYGLHRRLTAAGIHSQVIAPTLIPVKSGDRVKTDKRDAVKLAHFLRSGDLTPVWVPASDTEAVRDLVRMRDDAKHNQQAARHRLSKFLLRHDRRYPRKTRWTGMHHQWIRTQKFDHEAQTRVLTEYVHTVEDAGERVARAEADIEELVTETPLLPLVRALQALKGVRLLTAAALAVELGDLKRFPKARNLMSYLGLVVSEDSTGDSQRRGGITKTGNKHVRRLLVEAAWAYRHPPKKSASLVKRSAGLPARILAIGWTAQHRLHRRYRRLLGRGKSRQVAITAIARELVGFIWAIGQEVQIGRN